MLKLSISNNQQQIPVPPDMPDPEAQVWRDDEGKVSAFGYTEDGEHWMHLRGLASFRFGESNQVTAFPLLSAEPSIVQDAFRRVVLPMALYAHGIEVLHASAVEFPEGVIALCASSGTGKSTLAYGFSRRGYPLWADDAVAFATTQCGANTLELPFRIRLLQSARSFFALDPGAVETLPDSALTDMDAFATKPLAALCVLKRLPSDADNAVTVVRLSPAEAFLSLLEHSYYFDLHDLKRRRLMVQNYLNLTARVPVWRVEFRPSLEQLGALLTSIEQAVQGVNGCSPHWTASLEGQSQ